MTQQEYNDGYSIGLDAADNFMNHWLRNGPPIPWPTSHLRIPFFLNVCMPYLLKLYEEGCKDEARSMGYSAGVVYIPDDVRKGVEAGLRYRLTKLIGERILR